MARRLAGMSLMALLGPLQDETGGAYAEIPQQIEPANPTETLASMTAKRLCR
jgi:hypothetical protein